MKGPFPYGSLVVLSDPGILENGRIIRGERYRVIKQFTDADATIHPLGEEWTFLAPTLDRDTDVLTLFVRSPSGDEWAIGLIANWRSHPGQADVMENWLDYLAPVGPDGTARPIPPDQRFRRMRVVTLTTAAVDKAREFCAEGGMPYLRITGTPVERRLALSIQPEAKLDARRDVVDESEGFSVVIDIDCVIYLQGGTLDWREAPGGGTFTIDR